MCKENEAEPLNLEDSQIIDAAIMFEQLDIEVQEELLALMREMLK